MMRQSPNKNLVLTGLFVGWIGLIVLWWSTIPSHFVDQGDTEGPSRMEALWNGQIEEILEAENQMNHAKLVSTPMLPKQGQPKQIGLTEKEKVTASLAETEEVAGGEIDPVIKTGLAVYEEFECGNCHKIDGKGWKKKKGPELDNIGNVATTEQLKEKIWDPDVFYAEGFEKQFDEGLMPDNFSELMTETERDALVAYLMTLKDTTVNTPKPILSSE